MAKRDIFSPAKVALSSIYAVVVVILLKIFLNATLQVLPLTLDKS